MSARIAYTEIPNVIQIFLFATMSPQPLMAPSIASKVCFKNRFGQAHRRTRLLANLHWLSSDLGCENLFLPLHSQVVRSNVILKFLPKTLESELNGFICLLGIYLWISIIGWQTIGGWSARCEGLGLKPSDKQRP